MDCDRAICNRGLTDDRSAPRTDQGKASAKHAWQQRELSPWTVTPASSLAWMRRAEWWPS